MKKKIKITAIEAFSDNYIWLASTGHNAFVVDPGESDKVLAYLAEHKLKLRAILLTHLHQDHIGGIDEILQQYPQTLIYEPIHSNQTWNDIVVADGSHVNVMGFDDYIITVHATPGHTKNHVSYLSKEHVFCGDALFSCGCGRLFEGDEKDLLHSMEFFENLSPEYLVCCGHEYTLNNIAFAKLVDPENKDLLKWEEKAQDLRKQNKATVPTTIKDELTYNPFLRSNNPTIIAAVSAYAKRSLNSKDQVLKELRNWKDHT